MRTARLFLIVYFLFASNCFAGSIADKINNEIIEYDGKVTPIFEPIKISYKAVRFNQVAKIYSLKNGKEEEDLADREIKVNYTSGGLLWSLKDYNFQTVYKTDANGKIDKNTFVTKPKVYDKKILGALLDLYKNAYPELIKNEVKSGDIIFETNYKISGLQKSFKTNKNIEYELVGLSLYNDIEVLVIHVNGNINAKYGNQKGKIDVKGYWLLDRKTLARVFGKVKTNIYNKQSKSFLLITEKGKIR